MPTDRPVGFESLKMTRTKHFINGRLIVIMGKPSTTSIPEQLNTWGSPSYRKMPHTINIKQSAISDHLLQCNCAINFDDFSVLAVDCNKFKLLLRESLLIKRDKPILNWTIKSFPLGLFD